MRACVHLGLAADGSTRDPGARPRPAPCGACADMTGNLLPSRLAEKQLGCHLHFTEGATEAQREGLTCAGSPSWIVGGQDGPQLFQGPRRTFGLY